MTYNLRQKVLLATPWVLLGTTYLAFQGFVALWDPKTGYLAGFIFYWVLWSLLLPLWLLGWDGLRDLFSDVRPRLGKPGWLGALLLFLPIAGAASTVFVVKLPLVTLPILLGSAALALVNGTLEEVLWRGAYIRLFPGRLFLGYIYPTLGFAIWHLAPQSVHPITMPGGVPAFIAGATFVGACWGWVAWRSGSIRWATLFHVLTDFLGLGATIYLLS
jgi:uncharacterized protein